MVIKKNWQLDETVMPEDITRIETNIETLDTDKAPLNSPAFTGAPTAPTPAAADNSTKISTTAFIKSLLVSYATLASPAFTGSPTCNTNPQLTDNSTKLITSGWVQAVIATLTKTNVGLANVANVLQYSASNPPPYPVISVNTRTGAIVLTKADVGLSLVDNTADVNKTVDMARKVSTNIGSNFIYFHFIDTADVDSMGVIRFRGKNKQIEMTDGIKTEIIAQVETPETLGATTGSAVSKATPIDADMIGVVDTADGNKLKKTTFLNLKAFFKTYFDTLYNNYVHPNHTGDVTSTADGATVIGTGKVILSMLANMATGSVFYRKTAGSGPPEVQTLATLKADMALNNVQNTADADKGISTATATALAGKQKTITHGTVAPTGGADGDVYIQYE